MQCTAMFSNEPTELITGYNSVFGAYNSLQDWVTTHVVKAKGLFRSNNEFIDLGAEVEVLIQDTFWEF